jgi:pimeloyl-ACP methyl ester carboxylesterase
LKSLGHEIISMDLPCDDPAATFADYADVVVNALEHHGDDVVLVGHSLAGHTIPLVASRRPVRALVYLCALVAVPGRSLLDQMHDEPSMLIAGYERGLEIDPQGRRVWVDASLARQTFYDDCSPEVAARALERLRPQSVSPYVEACALEALPPTPATYIVCAQDRLVDPAWSRRVARDHLRADVVELPGGHSPFLSRPAELAAILHAMS